MGWQCRNVLDLQSSRLAAAVDNKYDDIQLAFDPPAQRNAYFGHELGIPEGFVATTAIDTIALDTASLLTALTEQAQFSGKWIQLPSLPFLIWQVKLLVFKFQRKSRVLIIQNDYTRPVQSIAACRHCL